MMSLRWRKELAQKGVEYQSFELRASLFRLKSGVCGWPGLAARRRLGGGWKAI